jgi:hypothetical protein
MRLRRICYLFPLLVTALLNSLLADDDVMTGRYINGNAWNIMDDRAKIMYLTAFQEAYGLALLNWASTARPKPSLGELRRQESHYITDGAFTPNDYVQQIDTFYADQADRIIPVAYVYTWVNKKFQGAKATELAQLKIRIMQEVKTLLSGAR